MGLSGPARWRWIGGLAAVVLVSVLPWLSWRGDESAPASTGAMLGSVPPLAGTSIDPSAPLAAGLDSPAAAVRDDERSSSSMPPPEPSPPGLGGKEPGDKEGPDEVKAARPRAAPKRAVARARAPKVEAPAAAAPYDKTTLNKALSSVVQKAQQCDLWGRATGTAQLFVTFGPSGRVTGARLVGEPIASAAVARCILHHARAAFVSPFSGPEFTVSRKITLR